MTYTYAYKTSDGQRHEATMEASSREEVFATLRKQGIKAIKVVAADGSKANGAPRTRHQAPGTKIFVFCALCLVLCAVVASIMSFRVGESSSLSQGTKHTAQSTTAPRHQIYGDPAIVEELERGHFDPYLTNRLDQLLAYFAQPGKLMCPKGTDFRRAADLFAHELSVLIKSENPDQPSVLAKSEMRNQFSVLGKSEKRSLIIITEKEPREVRELKQIVNGLREELAAYLANGNGTPRSYWRRLIQRTQQEMQIYERTRRELEHETNPTVFEQKNQALRNLGLRTIPNPKDGE